MKTLKKRRYYDPPEYDDTALKKWLLEDKRNCLRIEAKKRLSKKQ